MKRLPAEGRKPLHARMEEIYQQIDSDSRSLPGLISALPSAPAQTCEYIIAVRHPPEFTASFSDFTAYLAQYLPCICYDASNAHTTLATLKPPPSTNHFPDHATLSQLSALTEEIPRSLWARIAIEYRRWLLAKDAVLTAGWPLDCAFWKAVDQLRLLARQFALPPLKSPWGAHVTALRFTEPRPPEVARHLHQLLQGGPTLLSSSPLRIDVGWYECSTAGFSINATRSLDI